MGYSSKRCPYEFSDCVGLPMCVSFCTLHCGVLNCCFLVLRRNVNVQLVERGANCEVSSADTLSPNETA